MASTRLDGEVITLSRLDSRVLTALLLGPMNSYEIARQCEKDASSNNGNISNGGIQYSLKSLQLSRYIEKIDSLASRSGHAYRITSTGQMLLEWEIKHLTRLVRLAQKRNVEA